MDVPEYLPVEEAVQLLLAITNPPERKEWLPLLDACGRVSAAAIVAAMNQPPFDRSPLDGYAIDHRVLETAGEDTPATLRVNQTVYAGDDPRLPVARGEAARIMTGAAIPTGATCIVRQEDTDLGEERVRVFACLDKHDNYCFRGEDVRQGQTLVREGERLDAGHIGALAAQGVEKVAVFPPPTVGLLSTGSELLSPGENPAPVKIYDSNSFMLAARAGERGMVPLRHRAAQDEPQAIAVAIESLLRQSDMVITSGGVSVGARDFLPEAAEILGARVVFQGVDCKPGSPAIALHKDGKIVLCLSGNPFAAFATFELLAMPVLRRLAGETEPLATRARGFLRQPFRKSSPCRRFVRARIEGETVSFPAGNHASGAIASLAGCNCMVDIPEDSAALAAGASVDVVLLRG